MVEFVGDGGAFENRSIADLNMFVEVSEHSKLVSIAVVVRIILQIIPTFEFRQLQRQSARFLRDEFYGIGDVARSAVDRRWQVF